MPLVLCRVHVASTGPSCPLSCRSLTTSALSFYFFSSSFLNISASWNQRGISVTQAFPIALFQHPLLLTLRAFHVLFGTDRKPFHCFTTWILTLMKEMLHLITEPLKRAPFPNEQTRRQCIPAAHTSSAHLPWAALAWPGLAPHSLHSCRLGSHIRTSRNWVLPCDGQMTLPSFLAFFLLDINLTCSRL